MSLQKFSVVSGFSNMLYSKKRKPGNAGNQQKAFEIKRAPSVKGLPLLENYQKAITLLSKYNFGFNNKKATSSFNGKFSLITLSNTLRVVS